MRKYKYIILKLGLGENVEKPQLVNFIAKVLEDSGFKVYKNFKTSQQVVDIYAILQTSMGDFGLVVACKNYDKDWEVGIDVLKEMEVIGKKLKASKVAVVTSSGFSSQAKRYAQERKVKLIDRNNLVTLAKKYSNKKKETKQRLKREADRLTDIDSDSFYKDVNRDYIDNRSNYDRSYEYDNRFQGTYEDYEEYAEDMEYYENEVGGLELSHYDEYDDDLYRAEFLNKTSIDNNSGINSSLLSNHQKEAPKRRRSFLSSSRLNNPLSQRRGDSDNRQKFISHSDNALTKFSRQSPQKPRKPIGDIIKPILSNPIASVAIVVIISYLIGFILGKIARVPTGFLGISELIIALVLSYGIVLYADREADVLVKGTIVFFISLVIIIILTVAF
ncbi:Restriction endonuclease [Methanobrevibacter olleyae]|uniref:Restriction endonuclease n=1 Tax=Methanobrevibacter olleyae TaxID=294671 RepID=A0A126R2I9_METOL|nr:type II restriction endonuclease [Methanobrevibacter olleyae]SFL63983.1 Restriction endonuclease [Methanobrevibacter olleyae]